MEFDRTDHIIVSLVKRLAPRPTGKGVLTIFLAKLLFLVDYEYSRIAGSQATDFRYIWYKHGPYLLVDFEERLEKLEGYEIARFRTARIIDGRPYNLFYTGARPRFTPRLDQRIADIIDRVVEIFKDTTWETLLQYVYTLDIVKGLQFGDSVDFGRTAVKTEDDIFLDIIADAFAQELARPLSAEHMSAIQHALNEPTNENIETAKRMLARQRSASRLS